MNIVVNGEPLMVQVPMTVASLLDQRGLLGKRLAVERNGNIVPRSQHADTPLTDGDRIEIVVAVGGG